MLTILFQRLERFLVEVALIQAGPHPFVCQNSWTFSCRAPSSAKSHVYSFYTAISLVLQASLALAFGICRSAISELRQQMLNF